MKRATQKLFRCAIYTRKSTDHNLELEFNSLDAQREACEAYIKSQAHEGWRLIPTEYDDGGHSGATLERPALQKLLDDVRAGEIDIIVVYKIDRLTRALTDFAKLVELFDQHSVSFVSITQSFNTTTSMGRLTLNVLLSFAQFEREVIGERVRDKISASKKKGIWVGGPVPMGYRAVEKKLVIVPEEAATIRMVFEQYLALKSMNALQEELDQKDIRTRKQKLSNGKFRGGCRFGKGTLYHCLKNRFYIGEVVYKDSIHPAEHKPIIDRKTFDAVQRLLSDNAIERKVKSQNSQALLTGLLFDDRGNRMTPTHSRKQGVRYRYYISHALLQARKQDAGTVSRVPADEIERAVIDALRKQELITDEDMVITTQKISNLIDRIEIKQHELIITLTDSRSPNRGRAKSKAKPAVLLTPWMKRPSTADKGVLHAPLVQEDRLPHETREALLKAIASARKWISDIQSGAAKSLAEIAKREGKVERHIRLLTPLAFASPSLIRAVVDGSADPKITVTRLAKIISHQWPA